jgi:outer membrane lipoprotein-sorting protein
VSRLGFTRRQALLAASSTWVIAKGALADECSAERLDEALRDIARARSSVTTLTGSFTQERTIGLLAAKIRSTGTLTLVRPDRLRWELAPPDDVVYWIVPEGLAYQSKTGQGRAPASDRVAPALDDLRTLLGGDLTRLRVRYDLTGTCNGSAPIVFEAVPKPDQPSSSRKLVFSLGADLVSPRTATILEGPRDRTEITFGAMLKNVPIDPLKMRPPG